MGRSELPGAITSQRIIPVARGLSAATASEMITALAEAGYLVLEITVEQPGGYDAIDIASRSSLVVGAGTITSVGAAEMALDSGAEFLVSPHFDATLVDWALRRDVALIAGGMTPTEVWTAWSAGCPAVKVFPASAGGPELVRSLLGPFPDVSLIPTGGVTVENVRQFLDAGAIAVGVGGWLTAQDDLDVVIRRGRALLDQVV